MMGLPDDIAMDGDDARHMAHEHIGTPFALM